MTVITEPDNPPGNPNAPVPTDFSALPQEITDTIIDHLHSDTRSLTACSTVCRSWRDAAQHHLLSRLYCSGIRMDNLIYHTSGSRMFAERIREVVIMGSIHGPTETLSMDALVALLDALPNLRVLRIVRMSLDPEVPSETDRKHLIRPRHKPLPRHQYRLQHLDFVTVYQGTPARLRDIVSLFSEIDRLELKCLFIDISAMEAERQAVQVAQSNEAETRCTHLVIDGRYPVCHGVERAIRYESLLSLEVKFPRPNNVPEVLAFLSDAAPTLQSFTLHLWSSSSIAEWATPDLLSLVSLRHVCLITEFMSDVTPSLDPVSTLLSSFPDTVTNITLILDEAWHLIQVADVNWQQLEARLSRFCGLQTATVRLTPPRINQRWREIIKEGMPTLDKRGVLR